MDVRDTTIPSEPCDEIVSVVILRDTTDNRSQPLPFLHELSIEDGFYFNSVITSLINEVGLIRTQISSQSRL